MMKPVHIGVIGEGTVKQSYQLMALLSVCEHCAFHTDDAAGAQDLSMVLRLAKEIAGDIHDELEAVAMKPKEPAAA